MVKDIAKANYHIKDLWFPRTKKDPTCRVTSELTDRYNCIAWAMRFTDRWVQPSRGAGYWWPKYNPTSIYFDVSQNGLIKAFYRLGFRICDNNDKEFFYDKVALYYNPRTKMWTHAARVINNKEYHSKAGGGWDFHHGSEINRLENPADPQNDYGVVYKIMKRHKFMRIYSYLLMFGRLIQKCVADPIRIPIHFFDLIKDCVVLILH